MKKTLLILAPVAMLALAACNNSETAVEGEAENAEATAEPIKMPPSITASSTYRCADSTILYVDFYGQNEGAAIRVGEKTAEAVRVDAPVAEAAAEGEEAAAPTGPMKSADGETSLSGSGKSINVKLSGKGAQSCKSS